MVTLLDYGVGNIQAFRNIYTSLNIKVEIASKKSDLLLAKKIILPGVGAFDWAMTRLNNSGLRDTLDELVLTHNIPVLGVCVGMQMMANSSEEGLLPGLGWIDGEVKKIPFDKYKLNDRNLSLPHMGWNDVNPINNHLLFSGITTPLFYFLHSFYFAPSNEKQIIATTHYGSDFTSAASNGQIFGVQFHPEKSHDCGIQLLKNFSKL